MSTTKTLSKISLLHYTKLVYRAALFLTALVLYVLSRLKDRHFIDSPQFAPLLALVWMVFVVEMTLRFFPSRLESPGCQKQFAKAFQPKETPVPKVDLNSARSTFAVAAAWLALNAGIGILYFCGVIDKGILLVISLAFSVCDMICILFFCPFQTWFMKNKCCVSCRIYNWDYAMMFTPLVFVPLWYSWSLVLCAIALLARWELAVRRHPERFSETTNSALACVNCQEKLCHHKKQLRRFLKENRERFR